MNKSELSVQGSCQ